MKSCCLNAWDTNKSLQATLRFIYENQKNPNGGYYSTNLYLAISLTKDQDYENLDTRESAFNIIFGVIVEVKENYCKIQTTSTCENEVQIFTVAYSDIDNIISEVLSVYGEKYIKYMNNLPLLCKTCGNRYYDLLVKLEQTLLTLEETDKIHLIYAGIFSFAYPKNDYKILKNLIYLNNIGVVPITSISGFFIVENEDVKNNIELVVTDDNKCGRRCF